MAESLASKKRLIIAFSKHHLEKALYLSKFSESRIIYIGKLNLDIAKSVINIQCLRNINELKKIRINEAYNCFVFAMQPHLSFISFLVNVRSQGGMVIHLEETHQLQMHSGLVNTFQLIPDAILLASKGEFLSYKERFPNNTPIFLKHGWIFQEATTKKAKKISSQKISGILLLFAAPQTLSILNSENYKQRLNLIKKVKGRWNKNKLFIKLHPSEDKVKFLNFLKKSDIHDFKIINSDISEIGLQNFRVISSDKSQITIDLIINNANFYVYCFEKYNFISDFFANNCIYSESRLKMFELKSNDNKYRDFKKQYLHQSYSSLLEIEEEAILKNIKLNKDAHNTNELMIEYAMNKRHFINKMAGVGNLEDLSRNLFGIEFKNLSSDKMFLVETIAYENYYFFYKNNSNFFIDDLILEVSNFYFSPYKFLRCLNAIMHIHSYEFAKNNFPNLLKLQNQFVTKNDLIYLVNLFHSVARKLGPLANGIYYLIDGIYKVLGRIR